METNWKNVIDNFLECYHCHIAHKEFVDLVDMDTYDVKTHGIWSAHFAEAGKHKNSAYDVRGATVTTHAVWWLWPNTCLLRYPGRSNFMVFQVIPDGPERTLRDLGLLPRDAPSSTEAEDRVGAPTSTRCCRCRTSNWSRACSAGCARPRSTRAASSSTRLAADPGLSEHGVHHFHGFILDAYRSLVGRARTTTSQTLSRSRPRGREPEVPKPVIITCAPTGGIHTPTMSPHLPITPEEIATASHRGRGGRGVDHPPARPQPRDGPARPEARALFRSSCRRIAAESDDAVLNVSTGGGLGMTREERLRAAVAASPEMASLNVGSLNFGIFPMPDEVRRTGSTTGSRSSWR